MFVLCTGHDSGYVRPKFANEDYKKVVVEAHKFFEQYGFEVRDGKPYDPGQGDDEECFGIFQSVTMEGDLVAEFTHHEEGPVCQIHEVPTEPYSD